MPTRSFFYLISLPALFLTTLCCLNGFKVEQVVNLLEDPSFRDFTFHLWPERSLTDRREDVWSMMDGANLHVSGKGWGYLRTRQKYSDYHLVLEYKWGERTVGYRRDRARDNGLLVHAYGKDGAIMDSWMNAVEAQLIEGGSGDILVLAGWDEAGDKQPTRIRARVRFDRDGEPVWDPGGEVHTFPSAEKRAARVNWRNRDPDWEDIKGFRGANDIENPVGEWNRMEVICRDDTLRIILNGRQVNEVFDVYPREGYICLQSEGAELWVRRWELWPLDQFQESWEPPVVSTDTGASETGESLLPRRFPWSPEKSQAAWAIDGDYEIELAAAEPVVNDPVDVVWDEHGRMFVAEMRDYPEPPGYGPNLSRIRLLTDHDGDGRMDTATTWAGQLDHVQGLVPYKGGLIATTRTAILYLKDNDGDGRADQKETWYTSNDPRHSQVQVSSGRWSLDNTIYFNNGLDVNEIYPAGQSGTALQVRGWDLRLDPRTGKLSRITGRGQYGASFDDWGRRFFSTNRNPIISAILPVEALERNPAAAIASGYEDLQEPGAPVYPIAISHTTAADHLGTHTAACGLAVYRGDLMPELQGQIFVCEPTGQLVTRNRLEAKGASFRARRIGDRRDFLASSDEWTRPVQVRNGPDGALYICDMYRRFIDHRIFFPDEFAETNYMRAGLDHGRIWRLVPRGKSPRKIEGLPTASEDLVPLLAHANAWQRVHAQRLLVERQAMETVPAIRALFEATDSPTGRIHALWTLKGLGSLSNELVSLALTDPHPGMRETAIAQADPVIHEAALRALIDPGSPRLSYLAILRLGDLEQTHSGWLERYAALLEAGGAEDPWIRKAILSARAPLSASVVVRLLESGRAHLFTDLLNEFTAEVAARGDWAGLGRILGNLDPGNPGLADLSVVAGLSKGLPRGEHAWKSTANLLNSQRPPLNAAARAVIHAVVTEAVLIARDSGNAESERLAVLPLVQEKGADEVFQVARALVDQSSGPELQAAAVRLLSGINHLRSTEFFLDHWSDMGVSARQEAIERMASREDTAVLLMKCMKAGDINPALMPPFRRWWLTRRRAPETMALAQELFGKADADRSALITAYKDALQTNRGDAERGKKVFTRAACVTCHVFNNEGVEVGPGLADVRFKPPVALLTDILDPNRAVEGRWALYQVETDDGNRLAGLIANETASTIEIRLPGGHTEQIPRNRVKSLETEGLSLMPAGLENTLSPSDMADLIAYLTSS